MTEKTKKSLGQHWLYDDASLEAMCDAADIQPEDNVLEIGPGLGTLTEKLLAHGALVRAVEFDPVLIPRLKKKFKASQNFQIEHADILKYDLDKLPVGYKIVANIPYYLTSNLLRRLSEVPNHFSTAALLVQKEVAERVAAEAGDMNLLSVSVQLYCDVKLGITVSKELFTPPPKVNSQILKLTHRGSILFPSIDTKLFFQLVKAGFSARRKKLRSSLSGGLQITKPQAEILLTKADIDPNLRSQALSLEDWQRLYVAYNDYIH
ncbi:ribosomal RNA small subunit methyltransferase A [Candidatus Saccharibacteria bacterium]|nr:ribosomal RNA small subunit methyltransferase A [Candidatus Saccharibacteria bacterium]